MLTTPLVLVYHYLLDIPVLIKMKTILVDFDASLEPNEMLQGSQSLLDIEICNDKCGNADRAGLSIYNTDKWHLVTVDPKEFYDQICIAVGDKLVKEIVLQIATAELSYHLHFSLTAASKYLSGSKSSFTNADPYILKEMWKRWLPLALTGLDFFRFKDDHTVQ